MKRIILLLFVLLGSHSFAQELSTLGTDFWVAFMPNWYDDDDDSYKISIGGPRACSVTIANPLTSRIRTIQIAANTITDVDLLESECWQPGSCVIRNKGFHITSDDSVQVMVYNHSGTQSSCAATMLYTTASLGNEYFVQTYPSTISDPQAHSQFSILAIQDSTVVDITYSGTTSTGVSSGSTQTITLNAGQVFQVQGARSNGDLTATRITSIEHECLPFAVFMGNSATNCPSTNLNSSDHTFVQAIPTRAWQTEWLLTPSYVGNQDVVRVTAKANATQVIADGLLLSTLSRGQTYEFQITQPVHLVTSEPALVVQYLCGRPSTQQGAFGDVASFVPNSISCASRYSVFKTLPMNRRGAYPNYWYLNVVAPTSEVSLLSLDNTPLTIASQMMTDTMYSVVRMYLTDGNHVLSTSGSGFYAHSYGLSENYEAYAVSLGGGTPIEEQIVYRIDTCYDTVCTFPYSFHGAKFYYPGEYLVPVTCSRKAHLFLTGTEPDTIVVDTLVCGSICGWMDTSYALPGTYYHTLGRNRHGCDSVSQLNLRLFPTYDTSFSYSVCDSTFTFLDSTFVVSEIPIDYDFHLSSIHGCDSTVRLHLEMGVPLYTDIDWGSCTDTLYPYADTLLPVPGVHRFVYVSHWGCDSIVTLRLERYPSYYFLTEDTITYGQQYRWVDGVEYEDSANVVLEFVSELGCDSIRQLILHVIYLDQTTIWVPNVFTPNKAENNVFRIMCDNVDQMEVAVFDRRGDLVCMFDGLTETWDGTRGGVPCPQGTYVCRICYHVPGSRAKEFPITRTVTLLR